MPRICVLGSINMDLVIRCPRLPVPGETVLAESAQEICGGKGANQAVAAARAGGEVSLIARVGGDAFAQRLLANLQREQINCRWVLETPDSPSGLAIVGVEQSGQNAIMVVPGANAALSPADVLAAREVIQSAEVLLLQLEVPMDAVSAAIDIARQAGVRIILDPAPVPPRFPETCFDVDLLCPNETEAAAILGRPIRSLEEAASGAREIAARGSRQVAITLGEQGTLLWDGEQVHRIASFPVSAIDTTAAGDAFAGALAVALAEQRPLLDAVKFANAAGAITATRVGAQPSLAPRSEIEELRDR